MGNLDLEKLARSREALLLAELGAWLHDWQKCIDMAIASHWSNSSCLICGGKISQWKQRGNSYKPGDFSKALEGKSVDIWDSSTISLKELTEKGREPSKAQNDPSHLVKVLGKSHDVAHVEKELKDNENKDQATDYLCTAWGFEGNQPNGFLEALISQVEPKIDSFVTNRKEALSAIWNVFKDAWGDTRRPINEVTLWDWSSIVASLYKAELARCVLTDEQREPDKIAWRLLSVRTDGLSYLLCSPGIPDLLARKKLLQNAWDRVRKLLEETYPLGLEVFRDENGPVFVVPDIEDILEALAGMKKEGEPEKTLREHVLESFSEGTIQNDEDLAIDGEVVPVFKLDDEPWKGKRNKKIEVPPIGAHLKETPSLQSDPTVIAGTWCSYKADICTVCGLRPQGPGQKATDRNVCDICEKRRADRSKEWATEKLHTTIWTNEVADENGRVALIVGAFDLTYWLSGNLVRTLAVREPVDENGHEADKVAKNPSFARLRRIWETTRRFWQEVCPTCENDGRLEESIIGQAVEKKGPRLEIKGKLNPRQDNASLGPYHAYELVLPKGARLSVVWDKDNSRFITADNLEYLGGKTQLGEQVENFLKAEKSLTIEEPTGYGARNKTWGSITLTEDVGKLPKSEYVAAIPILAEPRIFMALAPAAKALDIMKAIKTKYEREMGKVLNRLPLHLGVVFAHRRTPFRAIMDAGKQMLGQKSESAGWKVICCARKQVERDALIERLLPDKDGQFAEWYEITLEKEGRRIVWRMPGKMGDGQTEDKWYPYVFLDTGREPPDRSRWFKANNPWTDQDGWLVHVSELRVDDIVYFTPSTFDYEFLDVTSRRFEINYDDNGNRTTRPAKPYYLDDLDRLEMLWHHMKKLEKSQRYKVISSIETTREAWYDRDVEGRSVGDEVFRQFVHDTLAGAAWPKSHQWADIPEGERKLLIEAGVRGELADLAELYMEIIKEKG